MEGYKLFKEAIKDLIEEEEQFVQENDSFINKIFNYQHNTK